MNPRKVKPIVPRAPHYPGVGKAMNMPNRTVRTKRKCVRCGRMIGTYRGGDLYKHKKSKPCVDWCTSREGEIIDHNRRLKNIV